MVKGIHKLGLLVALGFGVAISASGQARGFSAPMRGFSAPVRGFSGSARGFSGPGRAGGVRRGPRSPLVGTPLNPNFRTINGVPGLGFDFPHLAAVSRGSRNRFRGFGRNDGFPSFFTPIFFDPLPLYYPYDNGTPDYYPEGQQPIDGTRQPLFVIPSPPQQPTALPSAESAPRATTPQVPAPPPPELGQLILVRRDGQVLLAVAFTVNHGQLTYITQDGLRRSFAVSELDKDTTRQMNDANGTSVSLPE
jgi:hypothetical protein